MSDIVIVSDDGEYKHKLFVETNSNVQAVNCTKSEGEIRITTEKDFIIIKLERQHINDVSLPCKARWIDMEELWAAQDAESDD